MMIRINDRGPKGLSPEVMGTSTSPSEKGEKKDRQVLPPNIAAIVRDFDPAGNPAKVIERIINHWFKDFGSIRNMPETEQREMLEQIIEVLAQDPNVRQWLEQLKGIG